MDKVFVALLHSPMVDRQGKEVTTAVTNLDIHDIARSCKTYGIERYYIVNPEPEQERMVKAILSHWKVEVSRHYHPSRAKALDLVCFVKTFEEAYNEIAELTGKPPFVAMPDARDLTPQLGEAWSYEALRAKREAGEIERPILVVFGTGWGISPSFFKNVDCVLKPLKGGGGSYNHLSVRAAAAVVLDRVLGAK